MINAANVQTPYMIYRTKLNDLYAKFKDTLDRGYTKYGKDKTKYTAFKTMVYERYKTRQEEYYQEYVKARRPKGIRIQRNPQLRNSTYCR